MPRVRAVHESCPCLSSRLIAADARSAARIYGDQFNTEARMSQILFHPAATCSALTEWPSRVPFKTEAALLKKIAFGLAIRPDCLAIEDGAVVATGFRLAEPRTVLGAIEAGQ